MFPDGDFRAWGLHCFCANRDGNSGSPVLRSYLALVPKLRPKRFCKICRVRLPRIGRLQIADPVRCCAVPNQCSMIGSIPCLRKSVNVPLTLSAVMFYARFPRPRVRRSWYGCVKYPASLFRLCAPCFRRSSHSTGDACRHINVSGPAIYCSAVSDGHGLPSPYTDSLDESQNARPNPASAVDAETRRVTPSGFAFGGALRTLTIATF